MNPTQRQKLLERCSNSARNWIGKTITEETAAELAHAFYIEASSEWAARQQDFQKLYQKRVSLQKTLKQLELRKQKRKAERNDLIDQMATTIGTMKDLLRRLRR